MITQAELKERFNYDPETGIFTHKRSKGTLNGKPSGSFHKSTGYHHHVIDKKFYGTHRMAWIYMYGEVPNVVDHINGIRNDNRISNLRNVNSQINSQNLKGPGKNNTTGFLGVSYCKITKKFRATIKINKKNKYLGLFSCKEKAHHAYLKAKAEFHEGYIVNDNS